VQQIVTRTETVAFIWDWGATMRRDKGFSLIELLIVVAIILVIAAIAIPSYLHARLTANESSAVASIRAINTAMISYNSSYPTVGFAANLLALGGICTGSVVPTSGNACLIDSQLASGTKNGYTFTAAGVTGSYTTYANPASPNNTGVRYFCSYGDAVVRFSMAAITTCDGTVGAIQ
jgi:type IV pilus assembly protein PilA